MSVDLLQEKIRKTKNPSLLVLEAFRDRLPQGYEGPEGFVRFFTQLLQELKGLVPGVRFGFGSFAALGASGLEALQTLTALAQRLGYYVLLDGPGILSAQGAEELAAALEAAPWQWDGLVICPWLGSDAIWPFVPLCRGDRALFCAVKTANRSGFELQDLLSGSRLVHTAAADLVNRHGETVTGKFGYSNLGILAHGTTGESLRALRAKYPRLFILLDCCETHTSGKVMAQAFDKLGRGAAVCLGQTALKAWTDAPDRAPETAVREAAEKIKRNLGRSVTVL